MNKKKPMGHDHPQYVKTIKDMDAAKWPLRSNLSLISSFHMF